MKIPSTATYLIPQHDYDDYGLRSGERYKIKNNEGVGRYIHGHSDREPIYIDNGELRQDVIQDCKFE